MERMSMEAVRRAHRRRLGWLATAGALACLSLVTTAPASQAGVLVASAPSCEAQPLSTPFLPWLDPLSYELAPDGGFEDASSAWRLTGGAAKVAGNESHYVRSRSDTRSLKLPPGATATSATTCVGLGNPTVRLFARNTGSPLSTLRVEVRLEDAAGRVRTVPVGVVTGTPSWQPTLPIPIVANLLPLLPGQRTPIEVRFTARGAGGEWRIDDVYIDPLRRS